MVKICPNCGYNVDDDAEFCMECGTKLNSTKCGIKIRNFVGENDNIKVLDEKGPFKIIEYQKDLSVLPMEAIEKYFSSKRYIG